MAALAGALACERGETGDLAAAACPGGAHGGVCVRFSTPLLLPPDAGGMVDVADGGAADAGDDAPQDAGDGADGGAADAPADAAPDAPPDT